MKLWDQNSVSFFVLRITGAVRGGAGIFRWVEQRQAPAAQLAPQAQPQAADPSQQSRRQNRARDRSLHPDRSRSRPAGRPTIQPVPVHARPEAGRATGRRDPARVDHRGPPPPYAWRPGDRDRMRATTGEILATSIEDGDRYLLSEDLFRLATADIFGRCRRGCRIPAATAARIRDGIFRRIRGGVRPGFVRRFERDGFVGLNAPRAASEPGPRSTSPPSARRIARILRSCL